MPRGKRKSKGEKAENTLLTALRFIALAQRAVGSPEQTHCLLANQWAVATNGVLSAAHAIQEDISTAPHTFMLVDALTEAQDAVNLTQIAPERLSVRSGDFQAIIPCLLPTDLPSVYPDPALALCDDRLKTALAAVGTLATDGALKLVNASVQIRPGSCLASDGNVILEAWHGIDMPPLQIAPKAFVTALGKTTLPIARIGVSDNSLTLWYQSGAWLKTQLYPADSQLPELDKFLNVESTPVPVPKGLFDIAKRLQAFSEDGMIYFTSDGARVTNQTLLTDATNQLAGVPAGICFSIKSLLQIAPFCKTIHFNAQPGVTLFFGDNIRGAIATDVL
jgi:hypothetical protein